MTLLHCLILVHCEFDFDTTDLQIYTVNGMIVIMLIMLVTSPVTILLEWIKTL